MFEYGYIDMAQVLLYGFWIFFFAYIWYQRREDKRQGYPLDSDRENVVVQGFPAIPEERPAKAPHPALVGQPAAAAATSAPVNDPAPSEPASDSPDEPPTEENV